MSDDLSAELAASDLESGRAIERINALSNAVRKNVRYLHADATLAVNDYAVLDAQAGTYHHITLDSGGVVVSQAAGPTPSDTAYVAGADCTLVVAVGSVATGYAGPINGIGADQSSSNGGGVLQRFPFTGVAQGSLALAFTPGDVQTAVAAVAVGFDATPVEVNLLASFNGPSTVIPAQPATIIDTVLFAQVLSDTGAVTVVSSGALTWAEIGSPVVVTGTVVMQQFWVTIPHGTALVDTTMTMSDTVCGWVEKIDGTLPTAIFTLPATGTAGNELWVRAKGSSGVPGIVPVSPDVFFSTDDADLISISANTGLHLISDGNHKWLGDQFTAMSD